MLLFCKYNPWCNENELYISLSLVIILGLVVSLDLVEHVVFINLIDLVIVGLLVCTRLQLGQNR